MIYFDNAATTFPKPRSVVNAVTECISEYCGNPGRGSHALARKSAESVYETREKISSFLNFSKPENVVFSYNATYALNLALKTVITKNCHVICSDLEHNSVIRPLEKLKLKYGIEYESFDSDKDIEHNIKSLIRRDTFCIVSTLASNVTGKIIPLAVLSKIAREYDLKLIVDASQYIGYNEIDLTRTPCDVLCAPAHKSLYGIQGCGFAVFKDSKIKESFIEGGSGTESESLFMPSLLPEGYEAGTLSTPAIVALGKGIDFLNSATYYLQKSAIIDAAENIKHTLKKMEDIILYPSFGSIIAFNHKGLTSEKLCEFLDYNGICVRGGLHCAPSAHKKLGTLKSGCVRISLSCFNKQTEVKYFFDTLYKL